VCWKLFNLKVQKFNGSNAFGVQGSKVQMFKGSEVQKHPSHKLEFEF
jgi:hypothetical protein